MEKTGTVLVAGAGISGIKAAIEVAESGYRVLLTDASSQTGGILSKLDYQFPSDHCGMCRMLPMVGREYSSEYCMRKSLHHENIEILPFTDVQAVEGKAGEYTVELVRKARYVRTEECNGVGKCMEVCPVEVDDEFNYGLTKRKAIYQPVPHNAPHMLIIDMDACTKCGACVDVCYPGAIDFGAKDEIETREVNAIILATGTKLYNIHEAEDAKSYAVSEDVVSALAFERMLSSTGSYQKGTIQRPSDGKPAKNIAWIQCMGSRNRRQKREYCSSICCMFALKEAVLAKEKGGNDLETTIFYMDMRTFGKGFHRYRTKAVEEDGVKLIRCRVQDVVKLPNGQLEIRYFDPTENQFFVKEYDLVVLSTGQEPFSDHSRWSKITGAPLNDRGMLATETNSNVRLHNTPGAYICGSLMGLTDISEAISSGIAAAGEATSFLRSIDVIRSKEEIVAEPISELNEEPRVAVVICKCKESEGAKCLDLDYLVTLLKSYSGVHVVNLAMSICTTAGEQQVMESMQEHNCNRLLIAACQPYLYRRTVKNLCKKVGFHSSLTKLFDLQTLLRRGAMESDQRLWTQKIALELCSEVESLKLNPVLPMQVIEINQTALVVGGGMTGMQTAISLAEKNVAVHLVEKENELGGLVGRSVHATIDGLTPVSCAADLRLKIYENSNITLHLSSEITSSKGSLGAFETEIVNLETGEKNWIHHGVTIFATGGHEGETDEYCYNESERILTQSEVRAGLHSGSLNLDDAENVVMIQCVGSREKDKKNYCSRICCMWAVSNAIGIKKKNPNTRVIVLYRDLMTYGFNELYYTEARNLGVIFVNFSLENRPEVSIAENGKPLVNFTESPLNEQVQLEADYLVLSTGVAAEKSNQKLSDVFDIPLTEDGFFLEVDSKWRPIEFRKLGVFVAGAAHSPLPLKDCLMQASAAAQKAYSFLQAKELQTARNVSTVKDALCTRCKICVKACPFEARKYDEVEQVIRVDSAACQACGICAVGCRNNAAQVPGWSDKQLMGMVDQKLMDDLEFLTM